MLFGIHGSITPQLYASKRLCDYAGNISYPTLFATPAIELPEERVFFGFFMCGNRSGTLYGRNIYFDSMYLEYE